jgi:hypothetical protein
MTAQELRIGNTVLFLGKEVVVEGIDNLEGRSTMYWIKPAGMIPSKIIHFKGAPVTEKWLLEVGFEEVDYAGGCFVKDNITIDMDDFHCIVNGEWIEDITFEFKHLLQNLFFSLTRKELQR